MAFNLSNPTQELANTTFYQKYQEGKSKIQNIRDQVNATCDALTAQPILDLIGQIELGFDDSFTKYIDMAQSMYNTIANASQCISQSLGVDVALPATNLKEEIANRIQEILDFDPSLPLGAILQQIADLEQQVLNAVQQGCQAVQDAINIAYTAIQDAINSAVDKVNQMIHALNQYTALIDEVAQTLGKIAAVANCVGNAAGALAQQAAIFDPKSAQILQSVANASGSVNDKMQAGISTLNQVKDVPNKLTSFTNTLKF